MASKRRNMFQKNKSRRRRKMDLDKEGSPLPEGFGVFWGRSERGVNCITGRSGTGTLEPEDTPPLGGSQLESAPNVDNAYTVPRRTRWSAGITVNITTFTRLTQGADILSLQELVLCPDLPLPVGNGTSST
ncbi:hypothetical protein AAG570_000647 [Ranatra chinensis]|uniref:Uncharacterized protein n=1 Tax=Ranatra chinensis TaxID=642074 RepID=A0ABD0YXQ1_9HEMI